MPGRKHLFLLSGLACMLAPLCGQHLPYNSLYMEDLLYRDESANIPEPASADPESGPGPIDLNKLSADELEAAGILTSYQIYQLLKYRETYGPVYSIHELAALPGFHPSVIRKIESLVRLKHEPLPPGKKPGKHMVLMNLERSSPDPETVPDYAGSLVKSSLRIRSYPRSDLSLALSYEKDAGETVLYRKRPQFISAYLSYEGKKFIRQLVLGNYRLNQGLGLVNGAGFFHRAGDLRITGQSLSRIKAHASVSENLNERGIACRMGKEKFQILLWASHHKFSLSPSAIGEHPETIQWLESPYTSGYFRTENELEGRDLAYRVHTGIQLFYRNRGLSMGILGAYLWAGPDKKAAGLPEEIPGPSRHQKLSLHANWHTGKTQVFWELAAGEFQALAFLAGASCQFSDFIAGTLLIHHYGRDYRGSLPSSYGYGTHMNNEQGLAFHLQMESGRAVIIHLSGELFRFPFPRYLTQVPSCAWRLDLSLQNPPHETLQWRIRLVSKSWQTTPAEEILRIRPLRNSRIQRIDGQLSYALKNSFAWQSRLVMGHCYHQKSVSLAYAMVQQLSLKWDRFRASAQFVLFHVDQWANRIYLHEPAFYYSFSFPVYYGRGQRTSLLLACKPARGLTVSLSLSVSNKKEALPGWEGGIQIRLNL